MVFDVDDADFEARCSRLSGSLDAIHELVSGHEPSLTIKPGPLAYLLDLVAAEAHQLLDDRERPRGGPLRAVD